MTPTIMTREVRSVQNPALGSVLLWRFVCGFTEIERVSKSPPLPVLFIVLPILFHRDTYEFLAGTRPQTGLHGFADKFGRTDAIKSDVLLGIQSRVEQWRELSWESLRLGVRSKLMTIDRAAGGVLALTSVTPSHVPQSISPLLKNAEKLGRWCGALTLFEVGTILKVAF